MYIENMKGPEDVKKTDFGAITRTGGRNAPCTFDSSKQAWGSFWP